MGRKRTGPARKYQVRVILNPSSSNLAALAGIASSRTSLSPSRPFAISCAIMVSRIDDHLGLGIAFPLIVADNGFVKARPGATSNCIAPPFEHSFLGLVVTLQAELAHCFLHDTIQRIGGRPRPRRPIAPRELMRSVGPRRCLQPTPLLRSTRRRAPAARAPIFRPRRLALYPAPPVAA